MSFLLDNFKRCEPNSHILLFPKKITYGEILNLALAKSKSFQGDFLQVTSLESEDWIADFLAADILSIPLILGNRPVCDKENLSEVNFFTSGTSGNAKLISYTWEEIFKYAKKSKKLEGQTWFTSFGMMLYAGLQVLAQVISANGKIVLGNSENIALNENVIKRLSNFNINSSPSWLRNLLTFCDMEGVSPNRVILGAESAPQKLLNDLKARFKDSKIVHIYASSELGKCFEAHDCKEGFPISCLGDNFKIEDSKLFAKRDGKWFDTHDIAEIVGDRFFFRGRTCDIVNVGGQKVSLIEIEKIFENIDEIIDLKVCGIKNSMSGEIISMEVLCKPNDVEKVKNCIKQISDAKLNKFQKPRIVNFVDKIELNTAGKKNRI